MHILEVDDHLGADNLIAGAVARNADDGIGIPEIPAGWRISRFSCCSKKAQKHLATSGSRVILLVWKPLAYDDALVPKEKLSIL